LRAAKSGNYLRTFSFEENIGQAPSGVAFVARQAARTLLFSPGRLTAQVYRSFSGVRPDIRSPAPGFRPSKVSYHRVAAETLQIRFSNCNTAAAAEGEERLPGKSHYFIGSDPLRWVKDVPHYRRIRFREIYPGIDLVYSGSADHLEYDFYVDAGANARQIEMEFNTGPGLPNVAIDRGGNLVVQGRLGRLLQHKPVAYQYKAGTRVEVACRYIRITPRRIGFDLGAHDVGLPVIIDPVIVFSTYWGGTGADEGDAVAVDGAGNIYVAGRSKSIDFPTTAGSYQPGKYPFDLDYDAFVAKFSGTGVLLYSTYLGGNASDGDSEVSLAVDTSGNVWIAGATASTNFPTVNAFQPALQGGRDIWVSKLNPTGSALIYSTYLGGSLDEFLGRVALDTQENLYLTGTTYSSDFPVVGSTQALAGSSDAIVTKISAVGNSLVYSRFLGGNQGEIGSSIAVDASGNVYVTGATVSADFPTKDTFQPLKFGNCASVAGFIFCPDAFVTQIGPSGNDLVFSTFLGGTSNDQGTAVAVDANASIYVAGVTYSNDFPTVNAYKAACPECTYRFPTPSSDSFLLKITPDRRSIEYATYLGGTSYEQATRMVLGPGGSVYVSGWTSSPDFPLIRPLQAYNGAIDGFIAKFHPSGTSLDFATYLGGDESDLLKMIVVDSSDVVYVCGTTSSSYFPTARPLQSNRKGIQDAFLTKIAPSQTMPTSGFFTLTPCRVADTRNAAGPQGGPALAANSDRTFNISGQCGVPMTAKAVAANVTVTAASAAGDLRLYPTGIFAAFASTINYRPGLTRANNALLQLGDGGAVNVRTAQAAGTVHFILDVSGYFQ
jgi:hypothetical protein